MERHGVDTDRNLRNKAILALFRMLMTVKWLKNEYAISLKVYE